MLPTPPSRRSSSANCNFLQAAKPSSSKRSSRSNDDLCQNAGEWLLRVGRLVLFLLRHGAELEQVAVQLGIDVCACRLACGFASMPDPLKLRALVEDWSVPIISTQIEAAGLGSGQ